MTSLDSSKMRSVFPPKVRLALVTAFVLSVSVYVGYFRLFSENTVLSFPDIFTSLSISGFIFRVAPTLICFFAVSVSFRSPFFLSVYSAVLFIRGLSLGVMLHASDNSLIPVISYAVSTVILVTLSFLLDRNEDAKKNLSVFLCASGIFVISYLILTITYHFLYFST